MMVSYRPLKLGSTMVLQWYYVFAIFGAGYLVRRCICLFRGSRRHWAAGRYLDCSDRTKAMDVKINITDDGRLKWFVKFAEEHNLASVTWTKFTGCRTGISGGVATRWTRKGTSNTTRMSMRGRVNRRTK